MRGDVGKSIVTVRVVSAAALAALERGSGGVRSLAIPFMSISISGVSFGVLFKGEFDPENVHVGRKNAKGPTSLAESVELLKLLLRLVMLASFVRYLILTVYGIHYNQP